MFSGIKRLATLLQHCFLRLVVLGDKRDFTMYSVHDPKIFQTIIHGSRIVLISLAATYHSLIFQLAEGLSRKKRIIPDIVEVPVKRTASTSILKRNSESEISEECSEGSVEVGGQCSKFISLYFLLAYLVPLVLFLNDLIRSIIVRIRRLTDQTRALMLYTDFNFICSLFVDKQQTVTNTDWLQKSVVIIIIDHDNTLDTEYDRSTGTTRLLL